MARRLADIGANLLDSMFLGI
jgi:TatD DNase family protein